MTLSYEEQRLANIKANQELLLSLGLANAPMPKAKRTKPKAKPTIKAKRKLADAAYAAPASPSSESDSEDEKPKKKAKPGRPQREGSRRSSRVSRPPPKFDPSAYASDGTDSDDEDGGYRPKRRDREDRELMRNAQRLGKRIHDPRTFGHIPGVPVGTWWATRMDCSTAAVHGPPVAGISGSAAEGAFSVALSGGYPDDVDLGEAFTYTGSGGRDLKGTATAPKNLRTAPQTFDQSFDNTFNASLKRSAETRKPVRVIRGFKLDSPYAPLEGYRYDGLYVVERAWMAPGVTRGLKVCKYAFRRLPGQPPLAVRGEGEDEEGEAGEDAEVEEEVGSPRPDDKAAAEEEEMHEAEEEVLLRRTLSRPKTTASGTPKAAASKSGPKGRVGRSKATSSNDSDIDSSAEPAKGATRKTNGTAKKPTEQSDEKPTRGTRSRASLPAKLVPVVELPAPRRGRRSVAA